MSGLRSFLRGSSLQGSSPRRRTPLALLLAAMIALSAALFAPALSAFADDEEESPIRWTVSPANPEGSDDRLAVEHTLDPGEQVQDYFAVGNLSDKEITFSLNAADGFFNRNGRFDMLTSEKESVDSGTWISLPESVTIPAGEVAVVPFTVTVPEQAEPGDHAAGITASVLDVQSAEDGTSLGVESRVGFRVLTRVTGEITPLASVTVTEASYALSWNPLRPGSATVSFEVINDGNTRLIARGTTSAGGEEAIFPADGEIRQELLPGDERPLVSTVKGVWPLFRVPITISLTPEAVTMDGTVTTLDPVVVEVAVWAIPWPHLIVLLGVALIGVAVLGGRRRSRRRLDAMLAAAREEGRRSAGE
ncbi:MAG TPA: DUF916 domain-containing protein [Arachnia sp.]|nr:DUF916 domain-containing protein [Arachnia sp.]HMT85606.1 DUF916 domain-containing protein [Arachnia sp.]